MIDQYTDDRPVMLDVTHRMNADICATPSKLFYGGKLHSDAAIRDRRLTYPEALATFEEEPAWLGRVMDPQEPVLFVNVEHDTGDESSPEEATVIARIVAGMLATGLTHDEGIAVICAHRKQNNLVRRYTEQAVRKTFPHDDIDVENLVSDTVERIQGQERDAIVVSLIGSDPNHLALQWNFSHCPRRFNVAITRPRSKLIVVGSSEFFHFTPATTGADAPDTLDGLAALKRWFLDRLDGEQVVEIPIEHVELPPSPG